MSGVLSNLRSAWGMFRSESRAETLMAVVTVAVTVAPFASAWYQMRKE